MSTNRRIRIGSPATGDNFFPRITMRDKILRAMRRDHIAFLGPRRTGKTSILHDFVANPPDGISAIKLDLQGLRSIPAWLNLMLTETQKLLSTPPDKLEWVKQATKKVRSAAQRIEQINVLGNGIKLTHGQPAVDDWEPIANQFLDLLKEHALPIYFLLDEFPWFLGHVAEHHTAAEVDAALNWFRKLRQELGGSQTRFLVTGSIGLRGLLRRLELTTAANDFDNIDIEPLSPPEALSFLSEFAAGEGIQLADGTSERILERIGVAWPILLATFLSELQDDTPIGGALPADIDRIYEDRMVRGNRNKYCEEMFSRLKKELIFNNTERRLAEEILKDLSRVDGFGRDELAAIHARVIPDETLRATLSADIDVVIETLCHDGYIHRRRDGRLEFASNILRDYWRHHTV